MANWKPWGESAHVKHDGKDFELAFFTKGPFKREPNMRVTVFRDKNDPIFALEAPSGVAPQINRARLIVDAQGYITRSDWQRGKSYSLSVDQPA